MNSLTKLIASVSALIASLSFAWLVLTATGMIPYRHVTVHHDGGVELTTGFGGLDITHSGSLEIER
ncbi:MAG: hypothetical protein DMF36_06010 [Verrucomicrobia bacterium]|nr:MAG: hypothetical protein DMF36_06010 [Verrucomicrobiota bacterium]